MALESTARAQDPETAQVLEELIRESLHFLLRATPLVAWAAIVAVIISNEAYVLRASAILALTLALVWASASLHERHLAWAVGLYLAGLTAIATALILTFPGSALLYSYMLVVLITAMLTDSTATWSMALACVILVLLIARSGHVVAPGDVALPIAFILLAALTSWLSSRRLFTALQWALSMTLESRRNAEEARKRRAEVRGVLKSLDEAYARLERANEALIYAREAAEKAYRFKSEFVANVSHELRTPLNLIVGFSEMMATAPESYGGVALPSAYRGDVMAIYSSATHLADLINDVLDLSQIEAGRLPLSKEPADLAEVIRASAAMVRGLAEAKGLRLTVDLPAGLPLLRLDRTRIRQVLLNLLTNATRYTERGWIRIRAAVEGQEVQVSIEDSGRGIAADKIARAFEAFSRLDEDEARQGSGLGLAVSKKFVELHGGMMWIESAMGRGTTVRFTLPIPDSGKEAELSLRRSAAPPRQPGAQPAILVLHDDPYALTLLRRYVEGYEFVPAATLEEAAAIIRQAPPAAIIGDAAAVEGCGRIAQQLGLSDLPLLACPLPSPRHVGALLGAADYLLKPVARDDLLAALSRLPRPPQTVLVVDDDPGFTRLVARVLGASNGEALVLEASGGQEGLAAARSRRPDVVLLDLLMPEVSGYDLLAELKRDQALAGIPVIIMSARPAEQEAVPLLGELRLARGAGFSVTQLLQLVQGLLPAVTPMAAAAPASA